MDSLFDDPAFVAALDKLDFQVYNPPRGEFGHRRTLEEWAAEQGLVLDPPDDTFAPHSTLGAQRAMTAMAFAALVFVGAAAAGMVFHTELFRLIAAL